MFQQNYYSCNQQCFRSYFYVCKKFDNFYDANHNTISTVVRRSNSQTIGVFTVKF